MPAFPPSPVPLLPGCEDDLKVATKAIQVAEILVAVAVCTPVEVIFLSLQVLTVLEKSVLRVVVPSLGVIAPPVEFIKQSNTSSLANEVVAVGPEFSFPEIPSVQAILSNADDARPEYSNPSTMVEMLPVVIVIVFAPALAAILSASQATQDAFVPPLCKTTRE